MQLIRASESRLELAHRPTEWMIGLGLVCVVLAIALLKALLELALNGVLISAVLLAALGWIGLTRIFVRQSLIADRNTNTLRFARVSLTGESHEDYPLAALRRAETETRYNEHSSRPEPGLVLELADVEPPRRLRLPLFRPDPADLLQAADSINAWLAQGSSQPGRPDVHGEPAP